ncbi:MAG: hypothetical protein KAI86_15695, partial [Desulfobacterales bacterium]|nr:hypothetical protein [Desulfobacterales bacterium]
KMQQEKPPLTITANGGRGIKVGKALTPALFKDEEGVVMIEYAQPKRWALPTLMPRPPTNTKNLKKFARAVCYY